MTIWTERASAASQSLRLSTTPDTFQFYSRESKKSLPLRRQRPEASHYDSHAPLRHLFRLRRHLHYRRLLLRRRCRRLRCCLRLRRCLRRRLRRLCCCIRCCLRRRLRHLFRHLRRCLLLLRLRRLLDHLLRRRLRCLFSHHLLLGRLHACVFSAAVLTA